MITGGQAMTLSLRFVPKKESQTDLPSSFRSVRMMLASLLVTESLEENTGTIIEVLLIMCTQLDQRHSDRQYLNVVCKFHTWFMMCMHVVYS